tara:strand:- start:855 stop:1232 length:378 start_codon:yes stop_codon:yes gene_type:complete
MRYFVIFFSIAFVTGCMNQKKNKFKDFLVGEWRIENPEHQSFIRFEENGKTTYFLNQFSYQLDSLTETGKWELIEIRKGIEVDTFIVNIDKKPQNTVFKFIPADKNRIKVIDDIGQTFFTRTKKE